MTRRTQILGIFAVGAMLSACGGSDSVNTAQSDTNLPAGSPQATASGEAATGTPAAGSTGSRVGPSGSTAPSAPQSVRIEPAAPPVPQFIEVNVPTGTKLPLELLTAVSSDKSTVESAVRARLTRDVVIDGVAAIPSGTILTGVVTEADRAGRVKGRSRVAFRFTEADVRGTPERLRTESLVYIGEDSVKGDAARIGGGAVAGAVIGGILGGGKGAAEGAAIGGGAGTGVVLATRGKEVEVASGASVTATLAGPLTIQVPR